MTNAYMQRNTSNFTDDATLTGTEMFVIEMPNWALGTSRKPTTPVMINTDFQNHWVGNELERVKLFG